MPKRKSPIALFLAMVIVIALLALLGPGEKSPLRFALSNAENIMHPPPSPIFNSGNDAIIAFFAALILMTLVAAYFLTRVFLQRTSQ